MPNCEVAILKDGPVVLGDAWQVLYSSRSLMRRFFFRILLYGELCNLQQIKLSLSLDQFIIILLGIHYFIIMMKKKRLQMF